ncbi:YbjQ family protein [Clostridium sp. 'deep sea']|uniref:YbjQ family protein n=1 Tax=Clostridium sp. 'deep sea' TaxID=2779445 RepID=UPI0018965F63|nr:YbjQ family protein [Clostridium sp. 'deep sea']QOR34185.1 YbjQ family protein [Clostridium sp. 'deep sea']
MIITTTPTIQGQEIKEYLGMVNGEVILGINFVKDFAASLTNIFGGRSISYEEELIQGRKKALDEMRHRAQQMGANAVVGIDIDYEVLGQGGNMMMIVVTGTAVII